MTKFSKTNVIQQHCLVVANFENYGQNVLRTCHIVKKLASNPLSSRASNTTHQHTPHTATHYRHSHFLSLHGTSRVAPTSTPKRLTATSNCNRKRELMFFPSVNK